MFNITIVVVSLASFFAGMLEFFRQRRTYLQEIGSSSSTGISASNSFDCRYEFDGSSVTVSGNVNQDELASLIRKFHSVKVVRGVYEDEAICSMPTDAAPSTNGGV